MKSKWEMEPGEAEALAAEAFAFLAAEPAQLVRFLETSGMTPQTLRGRMGDTDTLAAVLDHILGDESLLLVFTSGHDIEPRRVHLAAHTLRSREGSNQD